MSIKTTIKDGRGEATEAHVTPDNALCVTEVPVSSRYVDNELLTRRKVLQAEVPNLNVDASVNAQEFELTSDPDFAQTLQTVKFIHVGTKFSLAGNEADSFGGNRGELTNGILFSVTQQGVQTDLFVNPITKISDYLVYTDTFTNLEDAAGNNVDLLTITINLPVDVFIAPESKDRFTITIRDNLSAMNRFDVFFTGFKEEVT